MFTFYILLFTLLSVFIYKFGIEKYFFTTLSHRVPVKFYFYHPYSS